MKKFKLILLFFCFFFILNTNKLTPIIDILDINTSSIKIYERWKKNKMKEYRQNLINDVELYIKTHAPESKIIADTLVDVSIRYNIDIRLMLAQGFLESRFGTMGRAIKTNSIFGVGAYDCGLNLFIYKDPNESIEPYAQLLKLNYLFGHKTVDELLMDRQFVNIRGERYASEIHYEKRLRNIILRIDNNLSLEYYFYGYQQNKKDLILMKANK